jgi:hypothetical protein
MKIQQVIQRELLSANSILKARLEIWRLWCNQFGIILLNNFDNWLPKLEEIGKAAIETISYLRNEASALDYIPPRTLLKVPFTWTCVSKYRRESSRKDSIETFLHYEPWITGHPVSCDADSYPPSPYSLEALVRISIHICADFQE